MIRIVIVIITTAVIWFSISTPEDYINCSETILQQPSK